MASAAVDVNQQRSDSSLASKSTRLCGQLIEDNQSSEKTCDVVVKCNHFSIRGYVSEVRKRDPKLCDPFSPNLNHELPPMVVPKFRWWQCESCVPETGSCSKGIGEETQKAVNEANADNMPFTKQKSKVDFPKERNIEPSTSTDSNENRNNDTRSSIICADLKGKGKVHVEDEPRPPSGVCRSECTDENRNGNIESQSMNHTTVMIATKPSEEHLNHENGDLVNEKASEEVQDAGEMIKDSMETQVAGIVDDPSGDGKALRVVSLPDLNEFDVGPSDDVENEPLVTGNSNHCEDDDDYLGAERRKTPKVRLLSELLGLKGNQSDAKLKKKHPSFSTFQGPSAFKNPVSDSPGLSSMNENGKRKRTGSHDDDSARSVEMKGPTNGTKKLRSPRIEESESESENDESIEIISVASTKRRNRSTLEKTPLLEKRVKKVKLDHGAPPSMLRHKTVPKSNHEKGKPSHNVEIPPKNESSSHVDDRNLVLNKGKIIQSVKEQTLLPLSKNHLIKDTGKDKEAKQSDNERVLSEQRQDDSLKKGTYSFPDSFLTIGTDHMNADPGKNRIQPHSSQVDSKVINGGVSEHSEKGNNNGVGNNLSLNPPTALLSMGSRYDSCTEKSNGPKLNSKCNNKSVGTPEIGGATKQVSNSLTNTKEPVNEVRGRIQDIDINSLPTDDKVPEQSTEDDNQDIPMDIVELMAKNQYERNLVDPKDNRHSVTVASTSGYGKTVRSNGSNSNAYEDRSKLGQPCFLSLQNAATTTNMFNGFEDRGSSRLNVMNPFSHLNQNQHVGIRGHVRENQVPGMSLPSNQGREHVSAFSPVDSTPSNWNRHMSTQRYVPSNFFPPVESYNRYQASPPRPNIDARVWQSRMPLGMVNPDMISQSSKPMNKGRIPHQAPSMLNFGNANLGKQNTNFSNAYSSGPVERPGSGVGVRPCMKQRVADCTPKTMGSVDLYSNETIPAMHLLSLMQNRANIQPPVPLSHDHRYKKSHETGSIKVGPSTSKQPLVDNSGRTAMKESFGHPCYAPLPHGRPFAPPFPNDGGYNRNAGFVGPIPLTSRGQRNIKGSHFIPQSGDHRSQKPVACDVSRKQGFSSAIDRGKGITRVSSPFQGFKDSQVAVKNDVKAINRSPDKVSCVVNRNPSEFNDLRELSKYTIRPEDLRPGGPIRAKPIKPKGDGRKVEMRINKPMLIPPQAKDGDGQNKP